VVGKYQWKESLGKIKGRWEDTVNIDFGEVGSVGSGQQEQQDFVNRPVRCGIE
jgi:hypothetical protein